MDISNLISQQGELVNSIEHVSQTIQLQLGSEYLRYLNFLSVWLRYGWDFECHLNAKQFNTGYIPHRLW